MVRVKFVGETCMVLNGQFIYGGETREIEESLLERITQERPGLLVVVGTSPLTPIQAPGVVDEIEPSPLQPHALDLQQPSPLNGEGEEVTDDNSVEHVEQPVARRRGRAK